MEIEIELTRKERMEQEKKMREEENSRDGDKFHEKGKVTSA